MFNEQAYLNQHPDVKAAVLKGRFKSGLDHFNRFGKREIAAGKRAPVGVAPTQPKPSGNPFDNMKNAFASSGVLKQTESFEQLNPFSNYFNANLAKQKEDFFKNKFQFETDRENNLFNEEDKSFRRNELDAYTNNQNALNQNLANNGAMFGGVAQFQRNDLDTKRTNGLNDYMRNFNDRKLMLERNQFNRVDDSVKNEEQLAQRRYEEDKNKFNKQKNSYQTPGYSF